MSNCIPPNDYTGVWASSDGSQRWYLNGCLHRVGAPARICTDGYTSWWQNGLLHREDGPAQVFVDPTHREDGPAQVFVEPTRISPWFIRGKRLSARQTEDRLRVVNATRQADKEAGINTDF